MKRVQKGFTLIELMIVVAIIGILAAIAIPQYADYQQRTKVAGAAAGINTYKQAVAQCLQDTGSFDACDLGANGIPGAISATNAINYVSAVTVVDGTIGVTTTATNSAGAALTLIFTPQPLAAGQAALNWALTGTGCSTAGRSIKCSGT